MTKKICSKCKIEKDVCEFYKDKTKDDGLYPSCKNCKTLYTKSNESQIQSYQKKWKARNPEYSKEFRKKNPNYVKKYYEDNKEKLIASVKKYYKKNKNDLQEKHKKKSFDYYYKNIEKIKIKNRNYTQKNREKINNYLKKRKTSEPIYKLTCTIRNRVRNFLKTKNFLKEKKTFDFIGCTPEFLKEHLQSQFTENMTWDNYGLFGWHIDHIIPLSSAVTEEDVYKLCHYTNLQPLWAKDNLKKSNKILN